MHGLWTIIVKGVDWLNHWSQFGAVVVIGALGTAVVVGSASSVAIVRALKSKAGRDGG